MRATKSEEVTFETFRDIAEAVGGEIRADYRGRFYADGIGIVVPQSQLVRCIEEAAAAGVRGAQWDNMGLDMIVYWDGIKAKDFEDYEAQETEEDFEDEN